MVFRVSCGLLKEGRVGGGHVSSSESGRGQKLDASGRPTPEQWVYYTQFGIFVKQ